MYEQHFGFQELPFCLTPDTQFYLNSKWHGEASTVLNVCIAQGEGFVKIVGEVGTGKTMQCRRLLAALSEAYLPIYIPNPYLSAEGLFYAIAHELGVEVDNNNSHVVLKVIEEELIQLAVLGRKPILIVDEAQSMPAQTLEALRLVTNLETEKMKLLQVVLFGQPELDVILSQPALRQLVQRITFSYRLQPLAMHEVKAYVGHRLGKAGYTGAPIFSSAAVELIAKASRGTPRLINVLAHKALMCAYGKKQKLVSKEFVLAAIDDTESVSRPGWSLWPFRAAAASIAALALGIALPAGEAGLAVAGMAL